MGLYVNVVITMHWISQKRGHLEPFWACDRCYINNSEPMELTVYISWDKLRQLSNIVSEKTPSIFYRLTNWLTNNGYNGDEK